MHDFTALEAYRRRVPALRQWIGKGSNENGLWWVKFAIDIDHPLAWRVVQEFGQVLNLVSREELLPTVFKPVSPPSYMNGGPRGRLPRPVEDPAEWLLDDDDEDEG